MSVTVTYAATLTVAETLANNTGSAPANTRVVTHTNYNRSGTFNSGTTPPVTTHAAFLVTLSSGTGTIDLRALNGTNGAVIDGNGLKVQFVSIKNLGANPLTIVEGASNGHSGIFASDPGTIIQPGGELLMKSNDNGDDISGSNKTWDLTGTGAQTSEWSIEMG
jgi:hypothetical protein